MSTIRGIAMLTRTVYWKGKFNGDAVLINAVDFDPAIHSDKPWVDGDSKELRAKELGKMLADEVKAIASKLGVEAGTKAEAIEAVLAAEFKAPD
jgi:hypothetical protein